MDIIAGVARVRDAVMECERLASRDNDLIYHLAVPNDDSLLAMPPGEKRDVPS